LYAAEIAINHLYSSKLSHQHGTRALDHPADSGSSVWNAWHIHCLHNPTEFSKFKHRDRLRIFLNQSPKERIKKMQDITVTQTVLEKVFNEFLQIQNNNGKITGKISVRDYVTALAWQKAYSATGAIDLS